MNLSAKPPLGLKVVIGGKDPAYLARVRGLPCAVGYHHGAPCLGPVEAHHVIHDRYSFAKVADDMTIPLCAGHHRGPDGIHSGKTTWRERFGADHDYIAWTRDRLGV